MGINHFEFVKCEELIIAHIYKVLTAKIKLSGFNIA